MECLLWPAVVITLGFLAFRAWVRYLDANGPFRSETRRHASEVFVVHEHYESELPDEWDDEPESAA
jgi:hypothetical protein